MTYYTMLNKKKKISFAIVTYNNADIIQNTISSLINNIPEQYNYCLYIIDNNSTDKTIDIVKEIKGNIVVLAQGANKGFGAGHNVVIPTLESEYHFVVNPDIIINDNKQIAKMIDYMDRNESIGMLSPLILNTDMTIQYLLKNNPTVFDMFLRWLPFNICRKRQDEFVNRQSGYDKIMLIEYASGCFMMFRTKIFKQIYGFDESFFMYLEDADITRRVNQVSKAIFFPEAYVIHKWERLGHKKLKYMLITLHSMYIYFSKWGWNFI